jgi:TRAP-type mannitol/chloroaromatic compound transport system substrate-binding protein
MTTRRDLIRNISVGTAVGGAVLAAPAVARAQQTFEWRTQCMWGASELTYKAFEDLCAHIGKLTGGRVKVLPFPAGSVVGVFETLDAVTAGLLQVQSSWAGYWTGKDAGLALLSELSFGYEHPWQAEAWYYQRGGLELLREGYAKYNAHVVGVGWWGTETIVSKKPITKLDDIKNLKIRSPQGLTADILTKLGASIVVLPGTEVYSALDKGVVDAADWATPSMNQRVGLHEVAKHPVRLFHSMPVQEFTVNAAEWKRLPDDLKGLVTAAVRQWCWDQIQRVAVDDVRVVNELRAKGTVETRLSPEEQKQLRDLAQKTWEEWSRKTPLAKKAYDSQLAWVKELGLVA